MEGSTAVWTGSEDSREQRTTRRSSLHSVIVRDRGLAASTHLETAADLKHGAHDGEGDESNENKDQ